MTVSAFLWSKPLVPPFILFVSDKIDLSTLKQDEDVANNLSILENANKLQANIDEYDALQEEKDLINNAHNEIKGVREKLPLSEKNLLRVSIPF